MKAEHAVHLNNLCKGAETLQALWNVLDSEMWGIKWFQSFPLACVNAWPLRGVLFINPNCSFWKKSLMATVITAVILIVPFCNTLSVFPQFSQTIQFIGMLLFLILGLLICTELSVKVNKMEAI